MSIKQALRALLIFLILVSLSSGTLSGFALASHYCSSCTQSGRSMCPAFAKLQEIFQKLVWPFIFTTWLAAAPSLLQMAADLYFIERRSVLSLVSWNVKLTC